MEMSSSDEYAKGYWQPGGTMSVVTGKWVNKCQMSKDNSGQGRWTETKIFGKQSKSVTIITGYRTCKDSITTAGEFSTYYQQWQVMRRQKIDNPNSTNAFLTDLTKRIEEIKNEKGEVIIMLDANESLQTPNKQFPK